MIEVIVVIILHTLKKIKNIFVAVLLTKFFGLMINLTNQLFFIEVKMQLRNLMMQFLKSIVIERK